MLNNARIENRVSSNYAFAPARSVGRTPFLARLAEAAHKSWKRYLCHRLARQTEKEVAKLSDQMRRDIGWPARYDPRESCRRLGL
ncbi:hypothetical protein [Hoeflea sp.]|uniref:hypothetical protein n=1 Tax=Hoeflea sp. TaxID=1940281 RepID=UPI003B02CAF9